MKALPQRSILPRFLAVCLFLTGLSQLQADPLSPAQKIDRVIRTSQSYLGTPHRLGGTNRHGIDCSGLMLVSFHAAGIDLPRRSRDQARVGQPVSRRQLRPGDMVFFRQGSQIDHVGLVTEVRGNDVRFIHASSSRGVIYSRLSESYWQRTYVSARRPIDGRMRPEPRRPRVEPVAPNGLVARQDDLRFPEASERILKRRELKRYLPEQLTLMKYELLATHGYSFPDDREVRRHFNQYEWYRELKTTRRLGKVMRRFSDIEKRNYRTLDRLTR
ncbi:MAG: YARHG domain-containing protein [Bacteroidetes bacterium]|nr:MAG: YARHG domain-containing protein [Bacteroidota bacterium]